MEERELDVTPAQVVYWLKREMAGAPLAEFEVRATREYVAHPLERPEAIGLENELDIEEYAAIGVLEISPVEHRKGWVLRVRIEDEFGPHLPDDEPVQDEAEEIDIDTFEEAFVTPGSGEEFVSVEVADNAAFAQFEEMFADLVRNRHGT